MYYAGLDLHKRYLTLCVLDHSGQVVREQRKLPATLEAVTAQLAGLEGPVTVVLEATLQGAWFHDRLTALGPRVLVAHPQQLKLISQARCKTDPIDARKLAELGRVDLVPAIWVPDRATRERRLRLRARARLVRWRTRLKNRIHALLVGEELGTVPRFRGSEQMAAYAGLVPSTRSSGGKTGHGGVGPAGNGWLKWILIEAVQTLKQRPGPVQAHYERLLRVKGKPTATVAAARKLCTYLYWMLREGWSYEDWLRRETARAGCPVQTLASTAG